MLTAIEDSRQSQAELSAELGERVRQAVEILIKESVSADKDLSVRDELRVNERDIYVAATRLVMRLVVVLFAEARDLLPRSQPFYHDSYGLQGLREQLDRVSGGRSATLRHRRSAWLRVLALFRMIHEGSPIPDLQVPRYGGKLFVSGDSEANDAVRRALTLFEDYQSAPNDAAVFDILKLLTRSRIKIRQGRGSRWVEAPVDFSDFSSEYIGILYEGLLDYELRQAEADSPIVFLGIGNEPALPLTRLEGMSDANLSSLLEKFKQTNEPGEEEESEEALEPDEAATEDVDTDEDLDEELEEIDETIIDESVDDLALDFRNRAIAWAERAVKVGNLVRRPRTQADAARAEYDRKVGRAAKSLISRLILPGQWYLVRWGGTRKGSGTFYTRPQLAVPTMRRTLEPLVYSTNAETGVLEPRRPEEILSLKVCDPAMGSGSFLVGALRYLSEALYSSLMFHDRIDSSKTLPQMLGLVSEARLGDERLPLEPDHEDFDGRLKARLKRYVVERCLYGVDLNEVAVELGRLALWIETMDRDLPFEFLYHKLKRGNALVGCWFDRFRDYPVMAWLREGGDKNHNNFVHHFREKEGRGGNVSEVGDVWTQNIKDFLNDRIKPQMPAFINSRRTDTFDFQSEGYSAEGLHDDALHLFEQLHDLPMYETGNREQLYREQFTDNPQLKKLKSAFDAWCAVWFWRGDKLASVPKPDDLYFLDDDTRAEVERLAHEIGFFHWEIEFPDVFAAGGGGFDAVIGNPPWEIQKPNSKEFFSNIDPLYRTYGKQDAVRKQKEYFENEETTETAWLDYNARFKSMSNWVKYVGTPFGDPREPKPFSDPREYEEATFSISRGNENIRLHDAWREQRETNKSYSDPLHPFRFQGSADINTYKMFLELAHNLLRQAGRLGLIVSAGVYIDKGSSTLRGLFLDRASWEWLFSFTNRERIFDIHLDYKFCPIIVEKGGRTIFVRAAFMQRSVSAWENAEHIVFDYYKEQIEEFSPYSKAIIELQSARDLKVLQEIYSSGSLLGNESESGWKIRYGTEFHMTNDSKLFPSLEKWQAEEFSADEYGHWLKGPWQPYVGETSVLQRARNLILSHDGIGAINLEDIEGVALPLYQGAMVFNFDFRYSEYAGGAGQQTSWRHLSWDEKKILPQFLMDLRSYRERVNSKRQKIGFRGISNPTNQRTFVATLIPDFPCGNMLPAFNFSSSDPLHSCSLSAILNSLVFDYQVRVRFAGGTGAVAMTLSGMNETRVLVSSLRLLRIGFFSARLCLNDTIFADEWLSLLKTVNSKNQKWKSLWAITPYERLRLRCILDAAMAELYGLEIEDFTWILKDCDYSIEQIRSTDVAKTLDAKGFWRVDKELEPELRQTVLSLVAFQELKRIGLEEFLNLNDGEGWMLPETLRLADYGLGHDVRAERHQPVASRLGERFMNWQLQGTPEESWEECARHAENIARIRGEFVEDGNSDEDQPEGPNEPGPTNLFGDPLPTDLFGNMIYKKNKRK